MDPYRTRTLLLVISKVYYYITDQLLTQYAGLLLEIQVSGFWSLWNGTPGIDRIKQIQAAAVTAEQRRV